MPFIFGIGRAALWGLSAIGLFETTKVVQGTNGGESSGPSFFGWAVAFAALGLGIWLTVRRRG